MSGRKSKLTPETQEAVCKAIRDGNYNHIAAAYAGIGESTFYLWMSLGERARSGKYLEFLEAVKKAEADAEVRTVALIETAAHENWQAAAWWLERKHNERWGRKERQEITGAEGGPLQVVTWSQLHDAIPKEGDDAIDS